MRYSGASPSIIHELRCLIVIDKPYQLPSIPCWYLFSLQSNNIKLPSIQKPSSHCINEIQRCFTKHYIWLWCLIVINKPYQLPSITCWYLISLQSNNIKASSSSVEIQNEMILSCNTFSPATRFIWYDIYISSSNQPHL